MHADQEQADAADEGGGGIEGVEGGKGEGGGVQGKAPVVACAKGNPAAADCGAGPGGCRKDRFCDAANKPMGKPRMALPKPCDSRGLADRALHYIDFYQKTVLQR
ncbi:hypothetical protein MXC99_16355 [Thauera aromatica]|uniref:hypothetical protein n=1 Tax=Thauera aromatica TaxID=59405 RepID=UPI001FFD6C7A|nr:hypothetical protein [Thauera aromatica]MCK2089747.1 hypothetical protein [Thauera aromatica]MCK2126236.1 hypothetical protein [Thauera aromatica]